MAENDKKEEFVPSPLEVNTLNLIVADCIHPKMIESKEHPTLNRVWLSI